MVFRNCGKKRMILSEKNESDEKGQKMDIFQRSQSIDFVEKSRFLLSLFFLENMREKIIFGYFK